MNDLSAFPGGQLIEKGLSDLRQGVTTEESLLVSIAAPRLRGLGLKIPEDVRAEQPYEHSLYVAIEQRLGRGAHYEYNSLMQLIVSFANAYGLWIRESSHR